jgi:hypothetical protein
MPIGSLLPQIRKINLLVVKGIAQHSTQNWLKKSGKDLQTA